MLIYKKRVHVAQCNDCRIVQRLEGQNGRVCPNILTAGVGIHPSHEVGTGEDDNLPFSLSTCPLDEAVFQAAQDILVVILHSL